MTLLGSVAVGAGRPDGIANASHQARFFPATWWHGFQVELSLGSRTHCRGSVTASLLRTYFGIGSVFFVVGLSLPSSWPVFGSTRFSFGSKNSVIWNGFTWMW